MALQWEPKIGPAFCIGVVGAVGTIISIGIVWGSTTSQITSVKEKTDKLELAQKELKADIEKRDDRMVQQTDKMSQQTERLGKIETSLQFIVPAIQRIETAISGTNK